MPYLLFLKKQQNLKLSSAANYRGASYVNGVSLQVFHHFRQFPDIPVRDMKAILYRHATGFIIIHHECDRGGIGKSVPRLHKQDTKYLLTSAVK